MADETRTEQGTDWRERALEAERWRDEVWADLNERAAAAREAEDLRARIAQIEASAWWRAGAPLRSGAALARKVRRRMLGR